MFSFLCLGSLFVAFCFLTESSLYRHCWPCPRDLSLQRSVGGSIILPSLSNFRHRGCVHFELCLCCFLCLLSSAARLGPVVLVAALASLAHKRGLRQAPLSFWGVNLTS